MRLERLTMRKVVGMGVALIGVVVLAAEEGLGAHSPTLLGDAITMAGSLGFALYAVLGKRVATRYDTLTMTAFNQIFGAIIALPVAVVEALRIGAAAHWSAIGWQSWASTAYMAVFGSAGAYLLYFWLLRYMPPSQLSAFSYLLPVSATILGIWWLGEKGSWNELLGGALVLGGVYWIESGRNLEPGARERADELRVAASISACVDHAPVLVLACPRDGFAERYKQGASPSMSSPGSEPHKNLPAKRGGSAFRIAVIPATALGAKLSRKPAKFCVWPPRQATEKLSSSSWIGARKNI